MIEKDFLKFEQLGLINQLLYLNELKERLWTCHPNNPDQIDIIQEYDSIVNDIKDLETLIEKIGTNIEFGE
jgi:hypothetical protein